MASSSSVVPRKGEWKYDVYLSFRGEDTRNNFVDHLYAALTLKEILVYKDDETLGVGQPISQDLVKAITESRFAVVVFSKNYANSSWCLEELSYIMECQHQMGGQKKVLPVFYHVDPTDVRKQNGDFAMAFETHEHKFKGEMDKVNKWRAALTAAANLPGLHSLPDNGLESAFIRNIVEEISINADGASRKNFLIGKEPQIDPLYSSVVQTRKGGWTYDVFLSFNARDTGNNFSDYLYDALIKEMRVFRHGYAGQTISEDVVKAIKESRFAVVVFSKNYAKSSLCLEELSNIMECHKQMMGYKVLPVFYHVDQSDICVQEQWRIQKYITWVWKSMPWYERAYVAVQGEVDALTAATNLPGILRIPPDNTGESAFTNKIVQQILADVEIRERKIGKLFFSDKEIGKGSNGTIVLEGIHDTRPVAVKRVVKSHHDVASKEIQNLIDSDHLPNIVRYYGVEDDKDFVYIALERCICSLHELILSPTTVDQSQLTLLEVESFKVREPIEYPSPELLKVMRDTVTGLAHLHELKIIHRDLKPQNVLICKYSSISAKVSDMGISKRLPADMSSLTSATGYGSSGWQAPEILRNERQTRAVDLFGLGCVVFFCITGGRHPFGDDMHERDTNIKNDRKDLSLVNNIPEAFDLVSNLIHRDPKSRLKAAEVYHHPLFWDPDTRILFFHDASRFLYNENSKNDSDLQRELERIGTVVLDGKWNKELPPTFLSHIEPPKKKPLYDYNKVSELVRLIRNKTEHDGGLPEDVPDALQTRTGFEEYFRVKFPKLLIEVYKVLKPYRGEDERLKKYYKETLD